MTSSLVGSEMCIRDSACSRHHGKHNPLSDEGDENHNKLDPLKEGEHHSACLLYTSDAADDM
eukprot:9781815-Prorocentrum_lima.AAC.1